MTTIHAIEPWRSGPINDALAPSDLTLLYRMYTGQYGDGLGMLYSDPERRISTLRLRSLHSLGAVEFHDHATMNWDRGMWGARLTAVGANAVFRNDGAADRDSHPGCTGYWTTDGVCETCSAVRPLDWTAYQTYLDAARSINADEYAKQVNGPQLYCIEHGWMRRIHITTTKVCRLPGTDFHDGGLIRA